MLARIGSGLWERRAAKNLAHRLSRFFGRRRGDFATPIKPRIYVIGAFPPPVHGFAVANAAVREDLVGAGYDVEALDMSGGSLSRSVATRLHKLLNVAKGLAVFGLTAEAHDVAYIGLSGGWGQLFDLGFVFLARRIGASCYIHHHSFAYLDRPTALARVIARTAGTVAIHVTLSKGMAARLVRSYPDVVNTVAISNAALLLHDSEIDHPPRREVRRVGFISNITREKGIFHFLAVAERLHDLFPHVGAIIVGPCHDNAISRALHTKASTASSVEYLGPVYGPQKDAFYDSIDVLIFPTEYENEAEPLVIHEAMMRGIPVIAYGRGCIPEIVPSEGGAVVNPRDDFARAALATLSNWCSNADSFRRASVAARKQFESAVLSNKQRWLQLLTEIGLSDRDGAVGKGRVPS